MATLFNTKIKDTYQSLLKLEDNTILTTTTKNVTDGLGNASPLYMSTTRIGVGTNAPTKNLEVSGTARINDEFSITNAGSNARYFQVRRASGWLCFGNTAGSESIAMNGSNLLIGTTPDTQTSSRLQITGSGSTSATTSLLVQDSGGTQIFKIQDDGQVIVNKGNQQVTFAGSGGISRIQAPNEMTIGLGSSFNAMKIYFDGRVGLQNDALFINNGNVGIGTSNPTNKLEVVGAGRISSTLNVGGDGSVSSSFSSGFIVYDAGNGYAHSLVHAQAASLYLFANPQGFAIAGYEPTSSGLSASNLAFMTAGSTRLKILNNGNVLIGTTTDSGYKLDVNGTARTGNLTIGTSGQGQITAGTLFLQYPATISYTTAYGLAFTPTTAGNGYINIDGNSMRFLATNNGITFTQPSGKVFLIKKEQGGSDQVSFLDIAGADMVTSAYATNGGTVRIYGGTTTGAANHGNVVLAHDGTSARGNVGVGEASPTARLQVKGSGSTSATTSLLVQNSAGTAALTILDDRTANFSSQVQIQSTIFADSGQIFRNSGNLALQSVAGVGNNKSVVINASPNITEADVAILVCNSTTKGFLPPRMLQTQRTAIASPAVGLIVYQTDMVEGLYIYKSTGWTFII